MKAEFIFTPEFGDQIFKRATIPAQNMKEKWGFMTFAMGKIPIDKQQNIIKISCCVESENEPPEWYMECMGKLWADDLERWRQMTGLKSTVSAGYMEGFNS